MLKHLVGVHEIERFIGEAQAVDVGYGEGHVGHAPALRRLTRQRQLTLADLGGRDVGDPFGEIHRDRPGPGPNVQQGDLRAKIRQQVGGGVLHGAPLVRAQH
jgi:hypothetical protein